VAEQLVKKSRAGTIAKAMLLFVVFALLMALGTWQLYRLQWKEGLLASIEAKRISAPWSVGQAEAFLRSGGDIDYQPVAVTGRFDHRQEHYFLATLDGQQGFFVYTPLVLADGRALFVNRGFVPDELKDPAKRSAGEISGDVKVTGLARAKLLAKPSFLVPNNDISGNMYFWKDLDAMAKAGGLTPDKTVEFFLDAGPQPNPGGFPIGAVTQVDLPNNHFGYAVTWYGLALALVTIVFLSRQKKKGLDG
jgi:surfeit locus 1 family protein